MLSCCNPSKEGLQTSAGDRDEGNWFEMIAILTGQQTGKEVDGNHVVVMVVERENSSPPALKARKDDVSGSAVAREGKLSTHDKLERMEGARQEYSLCHSTEMVHSAPAEQEGKWVWERGIASFRPESFRPQSSSSGEILFTDEASESKPSRKYTPTFTVTNNRPGFPITASIATESRYKYRPQPLPWSSNESIPRLERAVKEKHCQAMNTLHSESEAYSRARIQSIDEKDKQERRERTEEDRELDLKVCFTGPIRWKTFSMEKLKAEFETNSRLIVTSEAKQIVIASGDTHAEDGEVKYAPIKLNDLNYLNANDGNLKARNLTRLMIKATERKNANIADRIVSEAVDSTIKEWQEIQTRHDEQVLTLSKTAQMDEREKQRKAATIGLRDMQSRHIAANAIQIDSEPAGNLRS